ncbi:MAG: hypothetical protein IJ740_06855 [Ruminococcus sp.]|nr:hypothetical protein [Ruminococcus sp.]
MNAQFEKYIEGLSPELQEKARQCNTASELMELAAENDVELPMDALAGVAGGGCGGGCNHNFIVIEDINTMRPFGVSGDVIRYNGVQVERIFTKQCSKCSELHYYYTPLPPMDSGYGVVESKEISLADYNSLKAQKTW